MKLVELDEVLNDTDVKLYDRDGSQLDYFDFKYDNCTVIEVTPIDKHELSVVIDIKDKEVK